MNHWGEIGPALAADFGIEEQANGGILVTVDGQTIQLEQGHAFDETWLIAVAPIAFSEQVTRPLDALELNGILSVGALAVVGGMLVLRWAWPLAPLNVTSLDRYLRFLARESLRLRNVHANLSGAHTAVDFLAD